VSQPEPIAASAPPPPASAPLTLRLGPVQVPPGSFAVMAVINRTPDSFYDNGATYAFGAALEAVGRAVGEGAQIIDIGGVKAGEGEDVGVAEEIRRVAGLVTAVRERHPGVAVSVDTWRAEVAVAVADAGAHLINDAWGGVDPALAQVAADRGLGLVCSHAGGLAPRTVARQPHYRDVVGEVTGYVTSQVARAVAAGVAPEAILIDPAHDFGKDTRHSLELTRRLDVMVATGWPVLVALSNKDFIGEALARPVAERTEGTLAAVAISAWLGARVFRVHNVAAARQALAVVTTMRDAGASG
jgi:dihydropteroate synthase